MAAVATALATADRPQTLSSVATQSVGKLGACSSCGSADVRRVALVHEEGTKQVSMTSTGKTVGVVADDIAVARTKTSSAGIEQTNLAKRLAPPGKKDETASGAITLGCFGVIVAVFIGGAINGTVGAVAFVAGLALWGWACRPGGAFTNKPNARWNSEEYPRLQAAWERSILCMRCGAVTDPSLQGAR